LEAAEGREDHHPVVHVLRGRGQGRAGGPAGGGPARRRGAGRTLVTGNLPHDGHGVPDEGLRGAVARRGSFGRTVKAVAWSFFGVRKSSEHAKDVEQLNPL